MRPARLRRLAARIFGLLCVGTLLNGVFADAPARSEAGQTLVVPQEHLDLGEVYYVSPGEDVQIVCTSDAPFQRSVATCRRVVGVLHPRRTSQTPIGENTGWCGHLARTDGRDARATLPIQS